MQLLHTCCSCPVPILPHGVITAAAGPLLICQPISQYLSPCSSPHHLNPLSSSPPVLLLLLLLPATLAAAPLKPPPLPLLLLAAPLLLLPALYMR